jgi:hypothetical protein
MFNQLSTGIILPFYVQMKTVHRLGWDEDIKASVVQWFLQLPSVRQAVG